MSAVGVLPEGIKLAKAAYMVHANKDAHYDKTSAHGWLLTLCIINLQAKITQNMQIQFNSTEKLLC